MQPHPGFDMIERLGAFSSANVLRRSAGLPVSREAVERRFQDERAVIVLRAYGIENTPNVVSEGNTGAND